MLKGYKKAVEFKEKKVSIDPYLMGTWIGDKTTNKVDVNNVDVVTYLMKDFGLMNNKFIPENYKYNTRTNRLKILAGIIDSCGKYYEKSNNFEITHKNERVLEDIDYITRSLGLSSIKKGKKININGKGVEEIPTRKTSKAKDKKYSKDILVSAIKIQEYGIGEYYGFEITGNGRFLLSNFTVTHNSSILTQVVQKFYDPNDIGIISNDLEKTFGLSSIFDKYLFIGPEIKKNFALSQALLQSMISAEDVSIPVKHKTAESIIKR
jgi:replicative DNA helicase